jgi:hypothetical protein
MACTLVTAYYEVKSKHNHGLYHQWGKTLLSLACPIVIFVEPRHAQMIREWRGNKPLHLIELPFEDLEMWKEHQETWKKQHEIDPERGIHSPELYAVWAMKTTFVEKAIYVNPFDTEYFFWCDFGAFREASYPTHVMNYFPMTRYFYSDKIIIQGVSPLSQAERLIRPDGIYGEPITSEWNEVRLAGGLWGGGIKGCLRWNEAYKATLQEYFKKNRVASKEQVVMLSAYLKDPSIAIVVQRTLGHVNPWFFFHELLSNTNTVFMTEPSYLLNQR